MRNTIRIAAAVLGGGLAMGAFSVGPATAASAPDDGASAKKESVGVMATETYKNERNGKCLDGLGFLSTYKCDGSSEQKWKVTRWNDGTVRLKNSDTGKCISDSGGTLGMASCTSSKWQSFFVTHWNDGTIRFKNQGSGQCINAATSTIKVGSTTCNSSENQSWY